MQQLEKLENVENRHTVDIEAFDHVFRRLTWSITMKLHIIEAQSLDKLNRSVKNCRDINEKFSYENYLKITYGHLDDTCK